MNIISKTADMRTTVFPKKNIKKMTPLGDSTSIMKNEAFSFQLMYKTQDAKETSVKLRLDIKSDLNRYITVYKVGMVPVIRCGYSYSDDWFLKKEAGIYPDPLKKLTPSEVFATEDWQSVMITVNEKCECIPKGMHDIYIKLVYEGENGTEAENAVTVNVIDAELPHQEIKVTNWVHYDCISEFSGCKPFSQKFWRVMKEYVRLAAKNGQNMILTPAFTPPLDTAVGEERPTVQLVKAKKTDDGYTFDFSLMKNFIDICSAEGIEYFEHSHVFTQWGAEHAPKIVVEDKGVNKKMFGWQTDASSDEYRYFLHCYFEKLIEFMKENNLEKRFFFHISDEPMKKNYDSYASASKFMHEELKGYEFGDALEDYTYYENKLVDVPIVVTEHGYDFIGKADNMWLYYTGIQSKRNLSNRFITMPPVRNRILGFQLYYYDIKGFLQWGFNAHHNTLCRKFINPYLSPDCGGEFVAGTSYLVYPEKNGASPSLRLICFRDAIQDYRALTLLERLTSRENVKKIIEAEAPGFGLEYRIEEKDFNRLRNRIYDEIAANINA